MKKRIAAVLLLCVMLVSMQGVAFAAQSETVAPQPDPSQTGSLTVHLYTVNKEPVLDGSAQLVQVSSLIGGNDGPVYEQNEAFGKLSFDPVKLMYEDVTAEKLEKLDQLEKIAQQNKIPYAVAPFKQGVAFFPSVTPGLYLVMQDETVTESYTRMPPALVLVPETIDGVCNYDVDCYPKPVTIRGDIEIEFVAEKQVICKKGSAPANSEFTFILTPEKPDLPMPRIAESTIDPQTGASVVSRIGPGIVSFGTLSLGKRDIGKTYNYTIREVKGNILHFTYDVTTYTLTLTVADNGSGEPTASVSITDMNAKTVKRAVFKNTYSPPDVPWIPQTGQLWWPVAALAFLGVLMIAIGIGRRVSAKKERK